MSKLEQRTYIKFCHKLGKTATETLQMVQQVYGEEALSRSVVFKWHRRVSLGRDSWEDYSRFVRPQTARFGREVEEFVRPKHSQAVEDFSAAVNPESKPSPVASSSSESGVAGKCGLVGHGVEESQISKVTTASVTSTAPTGSDEVGGPKTHISTAVGGLPDRALDNRMERGLGTGFEQQSTRNRHMGRAHRDELFGSEVVCSEVKREEPEADPGDASGGGDSQHGWCDPSHTNWTSEAPGTPMEDDEDFFCTESKPSVEESLSSECPAGSSSRTMTAGAESADAGSCSSESGGTTVASSPGTSAGLSAGEDALAAHVPLERPTSSATTASGASTARVGDGDNPGGLKTHISTALGGLLDRALNSWLEKGGSAPLPSRDQQQKLTSRHSASASASPASRPRPVFDTELATQVLQQLSEQQAVRRGQRNTWDTKRHPYMCPFCEIRFEKHTTLSMHVNRAHKHKWISSELKREASEVDADDTSGEGADYESKPAEVSPSSECIDGPFGWPETSGAESEGAGYCPSETGAAASQGTPAGMACPFCHNLLVGEDALAAHILEKHPNSLETTASSPPAAPRGCSDEVGSLKTQISTALGGLLHRALNDRLEQGVGAGVPSPDRQPHGRQEKRKSCHSAPDSPSGSAAGRPRRMYDTELANRVRQQLEEPRAMVVAPPTEARDAKRRPYVCYFCELRFERKLSRNKHMGNVHRKEMLYSYWKEAESKYDPDDLLGEEDSDYDWREPSPTNWISGPPGTEIGDEGDFFCSDCGINFKTLQKVLTHREVEHGRTEEEGVRDAVAATSKTVKRRAIEALQELDTQSGRVGACVAARSDRVLRSASCAEERVVCSPSPVETDPLASPEPQVEEVFDEEETPFLLEWEVPDGCDSARDPLSIEDEADVPVDEPLPVFCEVQSIKEEVPEDSPDAPELTDCVKEDPDFDLEVDATDNSWAATAGQELDSTRAATPTLGNLWVPEVEVGSNGLATPNCFHSGSSHVGEGTVSSDTTMSADDDATQISQSGGAANSANNSSGGTTADSAANRMDEEQFSAGADSARTANTKPPLSYRDLIAMAISHSPQRRATFSEICTYIASRFPYYQPDKKGWKKSIRTIVSRKGYFINVKKVCRGRGGNYWMLNPQYRDVLESGNCDLRRSGKGERHAGKAARPRQPHATAGSPPAAASTTTGRGESGAPPCPSYPSTADLTAGSLSVSEVGGTGRATPDHAHSGSGHSDAVFPASDHSLAEEAATATSSRGDADGNGGTAAGRTAGVLNEDRCPRGADSASSANTKPKFSYVTLITMAIAESPNRMATLPQICAYLTSWFPYFWSRRDDLRKSVRHKLWSKDYFIRVPREGRKGDRHYWKLDPRYEDTFEKRGSGHRLRHRSRRRQHRAGLSGNPHVSGSTAGSFPAPEASQSAVATIAGDVGSGGSVLRFPTCPDYTRSTEVSDEKHSAAFEDVNFENVAHGGPATERQKLTLFPSPSVPTGGIPSEEYNRYNLSRMDNHFPVFTCSSCLQGFSSKYSLVKHVFVHVDGAETPEHVCRFCGEVFYTSFGLTAHLRRQHSARTTTDARKDRDSGDKCKGEFKDAAVSAGSPEPQETSELLSTSHAPTKSYKCNVCSKSFAYACYLKNRAVMDAGEKLLSCEVCGKLFAKAYDLKVHLLVHSGLKSLKCDVCGKSFSTVEELESHLSEHDRGKSYGCDLCGKVFATPDALKSHSVVHSVVESHKCDNCGKLFARVGKFELLLSVHSGVNSLACSVCGKLFKSSLNLKRHLLRHT